MTGPKIQILAVDDDANQLAALRRILRRSRFDVVTATNPRIGLRMAMKDPIDLVLLDVSMPTLSGHEFLRRLRRWERWRALRTVNGTPPVTAYETPVIFLTARNSPQQRVHGLDAGAADYVTKPFDPDELRARIRHQLRNARRQKEMLDGIGMET